MGETIMTEQVFYRKWRPGRFNDVVGQDYVRQTLLNALATGRVAHAYLFCGPRGTGKTSTARILAKALNCTTNGKGEPCGECAYCLAVAEGRALDLLEIDAASNRGIDDIRSLREKVNFAPGAARNKVYIIDEVHMLSTDAFNALLKTLEEPPPHTIFILATTEAHKLPATVISRCQRFDFRRISLSDVVGRLSKICGGEGVTAAAEVLTAIARGAGGSLRDAENMLEQIVVGYGQELRLEQLREFLGLGGERQVRELSEASVRGDIAAGLAAIDSAAGEGLDLRQFHRQLMEYLRGLLLTKSGAGDTVDLPPEEREGLERIASAGSIEQVLRAVKLFGQVDLRADSYSTLPFELALVEAASAPEQTPAAPAARPAAPMPQPAPRPAKPPARPARQASVDPRPAAPQPAAPRPALTGTQPAPSEPEPPVDLPPELDIPRERPAARATQGASSIRSGPPAPISAAGGASPGSSGPAGASAEPSDPAPAAAAPPVTPAEPAVNGAENLAELFGRLTSNWKPIIEAVRGTGQRFKIDALLRSGEPVSVEAERVVLGFPFQIFVDRMKQEMDHPGTRKALEEAVGAILGGRRAVQCIVKAKEKKGGGHLMRAAMDMGAKVVEGEGRARDGA